MTESSQSTDGSGVAEFEQIEWDDHGGWRRWVSVERVVLIVGLLGLLDAFNYHRLTDDPYLVLQWRVDRADWLLLLALVVFMAYVVVPLLKRPQRLRRLLGRLRGRWGTVLSLGVLSMVLGAAAWSLLREWVPLSTLVTGDTYDNFQPPMFGSVDLRHPQECVGSVTGEGTSRVCHGSWEYPLGTDQGAYKMTDLLAMGTRPVLYTVVITLGIIVPLATVVGVVAGYRGGLIDDILMSYVDAQLTMPALIIYLFIYMLFLDSTIVFFLAFGLLSWGGIARIVRSETLQRREAGYVLSARAIGASDGYILRRHIVPNVTNSILPATFHLISLIILTEAGLAFLGFRPFRQSWGRTIHEGLYSVAPLELWWISAFPAVALAATVVSCKIIGDGFRDILDPRGDA